MAMNDRLFGDSHARIARAVEHARAITKEWASLVDPKQEVELRLERRSEHRFVAVSVMKTAPSNDIAILIGEFFYQLRAALDALVYQSLVLQEGEDPPTGADRVEFPIYTDEKRFDRCPVIQSSLPQEIKDWLRSLQPFATGRIVDVRVQELARRLRVLHDCARKDRHRRLQIVVVGITRLKAAFEYSPNVSITNVRRLPVNYLYGETDFLDFDAAFANDDPATFIRLRTGVTIELGMEDIPGLSGNRLVGELEKITQATRHIVNVFEDGHGPSQVGVPNFVDELWSGAPLGSKHP